jgi:ABC-type transporter Mla MlaB component
VGLSSHHAAPREGRLPSAGVGVAATRGSTVTTETAGGACVGEAHVITVSGDAASEVWEELDLALESLYEDGGTKIAVDLSGVERVEPAGLEVLRRHLPRFRARGGDIVVACRVEPPSGELRTERRIDDALASLLGAPSSDTAESLGREHQARVRTPTSQGQ